MRFCFLQGELWKLLSLLKTTETLSEEELVGLSILMSDFQEALSRVQPSAKREGFATVPDVTWENVGALQEIREELTMAILVKTRYLFTIFILYFIITMRSSRVELFLFSYLL